MKHHYHPLIPAAVACVAISACTVHSDEYDTPPPYGTAQGAADGPANPIYDSPAVYEHDGDAGVAVTDPGLPADPGAPAIAIPQAAHVPAPQHATGERPAGATVHIVAKGDTLSGLSSKYGVPMSAIREANRMTNDTVVLGKRMIIPAR